VAARIGVRFEGVARAGLPTQDGLRDGWVGGLLTGELRAADAAENPALARAVARCHAFGAAQPTLAGTTSAGATVRLRPLRAEDIPACVRACQDPDSVRFTVVPHPYRLEDAVTFVQDITPGLWARGTEAVFAVADAQDAFVGTMALRLTGDELTTPIGDVGYLLGPWARGQGIASAALRLLVDWGWRALGLQRIEWRAYVGNIASRRTAERAGFRFEGEQRRALPHRGEYVDAWVGARLASDSM
jgi:RimJ/RimL family protein N-acetyltransferase